MNAWQWLNDQWDQEFPLVEEPAEMRAPEVELHHNEIVVIDDFGTERIARYVRS